MGKNYYNILLILFDNSISFWLICKEILRKIDILNDKNGTPYAGNATKKDICQLGFLVPKSSQKFFDSPSSKLKWPKNDIFNQ